MYADQVIRRGLRGQVMATLASLILAACLANPLQAGDPQQPVNEDPPNKENPRGDRVPTPVEVEDPAAVQSRDAEFQPEDGWDEVIGYHVLSEDHALDQGRLFEDPEKHLFLVVPQESDFAFVLEKKNQNVSVLARGEVEWDADDHPRPALSDAEKIGQFVDAEGFVSFDYAGIRYLIQPVPPVVGVRTVQELLQTIPSWSELAERYRVDPKAMKILSEVTLDTEIAVLFQSGSPASKRLLPALIKTVQRVGNPKLHLRLVGLDDAAEQPAVEIGRYHPAVVPAVIVSSNHTEVARFEDPRVMHLEIPIAEALRNAHASHAPDGTQKQP